MNHASLGFIVGHELTHGFDSVGHFYDFDGTIRDWWANETKQNYQDHVQCLIDQYGNLTDPISGLPLNGTFEINENFADNGNQLTAINEKNLL